MRDPSVELDASGKAISDDGFEEITQALAQAICYTTEEGRIMKLEEASFKGNELTADSLGLLAPVITLSSRDLQDLNLADNKVEIATVADARNWENFLLALNRCKNLRRLDLSGNSLGSKAFEILSRVYAASLGSAIRGLSSIPYIVLSNTAVDDSSALHLSYVIVSHSPPELLLPLVPPAKAGVPTQLLEAYDAVAGCEGIIYKPNTQMGNAGARVLELAEQTRQNDHSSTGPSQENGHGVDSALGDLSLVGENLEPLTPAIRRRRGSTSASSLCSPALRSGELDRARSRVQGDTLRDQGLTSNDLWWASMKMLKYARILLLQNDPIRTDWAAHANLTPLRERRPSVPFLGESVQRGSSPSGSRHEAEAFPRLSSANPPAPAMQKKPLSSGNPNATIMPRRATSIKRTFDTPHGPITFHNTPLSRVRAEDVPLPPSPTSDPTAHKPKREAQLPGGLSEEAWTRILAHAAGADGILSPSQQRAVVRWAMDKRTLSEEMAALGKSEPQQIWRVLHGMGCLAYGDEGPTS